MSKSTNLTTENSYNSEASWYVLYVKSRTEKKVAERLGKNRIMHFLPLMKTMRQWSDRKKLVEVPIFGGYVFVKIDPSEFTSVRMIEGVVNFVHQGKRFATIPEEQIFAIQRFIETGLHLHTTTEILQAGQIVRISYGPLKDCSGELLEIKNEKHFIVRLEMINQVLIADLPKQYLEKI